MAASTAIRLEREMLPLVEPALPRAVGMESLKTRIIPGLRIGRIVPDLVIAAGRSGSEFGSWPALTFVEAAVFALLEANTEMTVAELHAKVFLARQTVERVLAKLLKYGVIDRTNPGSVRFTGRLNTTDTEVVAIEFKLRRWRDALDQAISYQSFADRVYVILDAEQVTITEEMLEKFRAAEVGLVLQSATRLNLVVPAIVKTRVTSARVLAVLKIARSATVIFRHRCAIFQRRTARPLGVERRNGSSQLQPFVVPRPAQSPA